MISCTEFRSRFEPDTEDAALLEHLRGCDGCLRHAAEIDPDSMFRALGGEMIPPGGVDAFVSDVMHAVQLRAKEVSMSPAPRKSRLGGLAWAAVLATGVTGAGLVYQLDRSSAHDPAPVAVVRHRAPVLIAEATKPAVETYSSENATILEVPTDGAGDTKIVMVFDEGLPADL